MTQELDEIMAKNMNESTITKQQTRILLSRCFDQNLYWLRIIPIPVRLIADVVFNDI